ncbi:MAG: hypothetical protein JW840_03690 [Candidatus Thermoplasmatota archaeon]|nr:hypothetical protein [Candidatus Thermoplasmatota archaeon]
MSQGLLGAAGVSPAPSSFEPTLVSKISQEIELPPSSDYYLRFSAQSQTVEPKPVTPATDGLSEPILHAIATSPCWIQPRLTSQFHHLDNPESYACLLQNASTLFADEIAFSLACSPIGRVPSPALLKENAETLYEIDSWVDYAKIVEYNDGQGNYFSTIRYRVLENGTEHSYELPPEIYYWYVVHPQITNENIDAVYGSLWRQYLFNHNDLGYPLLKEKLAALHYLWDCESYFQPGFRLWNECIAQHPTAIEAVSYWVGKTVPYPAYGDRPGQASVIAHEHNGWCGELQKIAIAAQRAALVPSISACNVGEDHVWREFYERGWHENDNWWSDTGGAVNEPDVYAYHWGKNMSAIYQWRGDGTILEDTTRYIHPEDLITVRFDIKDAFLQPVDGARVVVLVKGPKDITYYKNLFWEKIQNVWDRLPAFLKGKILTVLFERFEQRFDAIPDIIDGRTITIWNYTDSEGRCSFQLGKNHDYLFLIQEGNLRKPWQLARHNVLRSLKTRTDKEFKIVLLDVSQRPQRITRRDIPLGDCLFHLSFSSHAYQLETHFITGGIGRHETFGAIECFFVDEENFQRYITGKAFTAFNSFEAANATLSVLASHQDWYVVFRNYAQATFVTVDFSLDVSVQTTDDHVQIVTPDTTLFATPLFNAGDTVHISGVATTDVVFLSFDHHPGTIECPVEDGEWSYVWHTSGEPLGAHRITVETDTAVSDESTVLLIDARPPTLSIDSPVDDAILEKGLLLISGNSSDNHGIDHVEVTIDTITRLASGTTRWNLTWDLTDLPLGDYSLVVTAVDTQGLVTTNIHTFALNESGQSWGPQILDLFHTPSNLTNTSNVIIFANVTTTGPFRLHHIVLFCDNGTETVSYEMYRYGDFPIQTRHEEDPLYNLSNHPLYGKELGQLLAGQIITYWVVAVDTARNTKQSEPSSFTID